MSIPTKKPGQKWQKLDCLLIGGGVFINPVLTLPVIVSLEILRIEIWYAQNCWQFQGWKGDPFTSYEVRLQLQSSTLGELRHNFGAVLSEAAKMSLKRCKYKYLLVGMELPSLNLCKASGLF